MTDHTDPQVLAPPPPEEIRAELERMVRANIFGPEGGEDEELPGAVLVRDHYLVGMLAPKQVVVSPQQLDQLAVEGTGDSEEAAPDLAAPPGPSLFPSSLGMTFSLSADATEVELDARWGRYERAATDEEDDEGRPRRVWRRHPAGGVIRHRLADGDFGPLMPDPSQEGVIVRGRARRGGGSWLVTAFLVNEQEDPPRNKDEAWLFQASLAATHPEGEPAFRRTLATGSALDDPLEARALDMAYRDQVEFALGHGIGVHAEPDPADPRRAFSVRTVAVPTYEVPRTDPPTAEDFPGLAGAELGMAALADATDDELPAVLRPLVEAYEEWIAGQRARIGRPDARLEGYEATAHEVLDQCQAVAARISAGIDLLDPVQPAFDPLAAEAFRFANRAMAQQRVHTIVADRRRKDPALSMDDALADADRRQNRSWRPFQLAFLLLNLPSLADPAHLERGPGREGLVDLLWFPTGGGKTEAYLGLSAFALAIRRLHGVVGDHDGRDGVGVLMRYTLRLLTVQQFQRAAALMCACERIRLEAKSRGDTRWGDVPFRLGLWVGYAVTPTKGTQAAKAIEEAKGTAWHGGGANPVQVTFCPWCGSPVDAGKDASRDEVRRRTLVYCGDPRGRCAFTQRHAKGEGLPLVTVDDEIYRLVPGMVIATADKFAQVPWQGPTRALFGRVSRRCQRHGWRHPDLDEELDERDSHQRRGDHPPAVTVGAGPLRPPDLVIQDELHLIAGPLGSLMGLYETAVDQLCTWSADGRPVRPKVVASTATVRRADEQAHQVFWRRLQVFPAPALDARDSFFALQRPTSEGPGRRYLGVCAPGRRIKAVEIRLYVALMGAAQRLFELYGEAADPWMTLVGYFSALRELAGMRRLVDDDVSERLNQATIAQRDLARRPIRRVRELTSRMSSADIPEVLDELGLPFVAGTDQPEGNKRRSRGKDLSARPIDVLLATNMISVGVDVPRLGLMVVGGQPKATAEYIQATSRVGRDRRGPGLVVTVLNWARPRDLSHYETFEHFHATFYRHVEALSVTPFAPRALDRGLTAVLAGLVRHHDETTNANAAAQTVDPHAAGADALAAVRARAADVTSRLDVGDEVERALKRRLDSWLQQQRREAVVLGYRERKDGRTVGLLRRPGDTRWSTWTCPNSLREVEVGINLLLGDGADGDGGAGPDYEFPAASDDEEGAEVTGGSLAEER